jgi:hypothetical protein
MIYQKRVIEKVRSLILLDNWRDVETNMVNNSFDSSEIATTKIAGCN